MDRMNGTMNVRLDNNDGWVPSHLLSLHTDVTLSSTNVKIGSGDVHSQWIPGREVTQVQVPISFSHKSLNVTGDDTQQTMQKACAHLCMYQP